MQGQAITFVQNMCTQIKLQMKIKPTLSYPAEKKQLTSTCKASNEELFYLKLPQLLSPFLKHVSKRHNQKSLK